MNEVANRKQEYDDFVIAVKIEENLGGPHLELRFKNGYGVSVIQNQYSYGGVDGLYELAVLHGDKLCYASSITSDVRGRLAQDEVKELSLQVSQLPRFDHCAHRAPNAYWNTDD